MPTTASASEAQKTGMAAARTVVRVPAPAAQQSETPQTFVLFFLKFNFINNCSSLL